MKKYTAIILAILMLACIFALTGCKDGDKSADSVMASLIIGDWYTYSGSPYRSFSEDGTVTGTSNYSSDYSADGNQLTWNTASGQTVTLEFWTDGEILRISTNTGSYFTTRKYYCRSSEGVPYGTGMPERGTTDQTIFGSWYNGAELFFKLNKDGSVNGRRDTTGFSFFGDEIVLFTEGVYIDEVAPCKFENDILTIYYKDEVTGEQAELVLTREPTETKENVLDGLTDEELFLPSEEAPTVSSGDAE